MPGRQVTHDDEVEGDHDQRSALHQIVGGACTDHGVESGRAEDPHFQRRIITAQLPPHERDAGQHADQDRNQRRGVHPGLKLGDTVGDADERCGHQQQPGDIGLAVRTGRLRNIANGDHHDEDRENGRDEKPCAPTDVLGEQAAHRRRKHAEGVDHGKILGDRTRAAFGRKDRIHDGQRQTAEECERHSDAGSGDDHHDRVGGECAE